MSPNLFSIPNSWSWALMEDIAIVVGGGTPSTKDSTYYDDGTIPWLTPADLSGYSSKYIRHGRRNITEKGLEKSSARLMPKGTVLFTSRAPIGYVVIDNPICTNQGFKSFVLKDDKITPDFVYWYLKGNKALAESLASGTTFLELSGSKAKQLPIPIAPLDEQRRIVAKIEELLTKLDAGIESLKQVQTLLKRYRQSVLKSAVEGKLTSEWRKQHRDELEPADKLLESILKERKEKWEAEQLANYKAKGKKPPNNWQSKYKEPAPPDTSKLPELPDGWVWTIADIISSKITDGEHIRPNIADKGIPFLSAKDVRDHGVIIDGNLFVSKDDAVKFRLRCNPEKNDILIVSRGATVGRTCSVDTDEEFCLLGSVILIKPIALISVKYLSYALKSYPIQREMISLSGSTAQQAIYIRDIRNLSIPLPPFDEQIKIADEVDRLFSIINGSEMTIDAELKRSQSLRQSILKQAFEGKLVSQDPNDEPASVLLERIKVEKSNPK